VASTSGQFTFNTSLASLHTYLGGKCPRYPCYMMFDADRKESVIRLFMCHSEVDDTRGRVSLLDGGTILSLPMLYLQGRSCMFVFYFVNPQS
jgi:cereblon